VSQAVVSSSDTRLTWTNWDFRRVSASRINIKSISLRTGNE
jgi:hypothetical protein